MRVWTSALMGVFFFWASVATAVVSRPAIVPRFAGAEIGEWTMDHDTALTKAREGTNNVVVMFNGAWWCPHCQALESTVLTSQVWQAYVATNRLYLVMMDNPGRADQYWCWLRETNYLDSVGLTLAQGEALITNRYDLQTAYALPGAPTNTVKDSQYLRVGYPTLIVLRPDGSRLGRFTPLLTTVSQEMVIRNMQQLLAADAGDEADDSYLGATWLDSSLCEDEAVSAGTHTLSETDAADWYVFDTTNGVQWSFALRASGVGVATDVRAQIFDTPTNPESLAERVMTPSDIAVLSFVVPKTGRYWLKISRAHSLTELLGYELSHWHGTPPATVLFAAPQVTVSERAPSVDLTVNITGTVPDGEVRVSYETVAGSARPGQDYVQKTGELVWGAGTKTPKTITIPLLADTEWEGDETFSVVLYAVKNCSSGSQLSSCRVVLKEQTAPQAGKLGFTGAAALVLTEGSSALFSVARAAGDDGAVTAQVEHVQGTLRTPVARLVWTNMEVGAKSFAFTFTNEPGFQADSRSALRLTPAGGASLLSPASGAVALTRRDDLVVQTFAEYAADPVNQPFSYKALRGLWFYGFCSDAERLDGGLAGQSDKDRASATSAKEVLSSCWLRSQPLKANETVTLASTVTGPGVLAFDWRLEGEGAGATLQCLLGGQPLATKTNAAAAMGVPETKGTAQLSFKISPSVTVAIPSGRRTVAWTLRSGSAGTNVFAAVGNLIWRPLPQVSGAAPADKAAVINRGVRLSWLDVLAQADLPPGAAAHYEFYAGASATALVKYTEQSETGFPRTGNEADVQAFSGLLERTGTRAVYWRVDAVVADAAGRRAVMTGKTWSLTVLPEGSPEYVAAPGGYDPTVPGGVSAPEMTVGVYGEAGPLAVANAEGATVGVTVKNGALPAGTGIQVRDGNVWLTGAPLKTGAGSADLHLTVTRYLGLRGAASSVTTPGTSVTVTWTVRSLGRAAGQYDGYRVKGGEPDFGNASIGVSERGALSGKLLSDGATYTFAAASFGGKTNASYFAKMTARSGQRTLPVTVSVAENGAAAEMLLDEAPDSAYLLNRNNWADAGMAAILNGYAGYYTVALPVLEQTSPDAPWGTGYLTATVKANGTVTYAGHLADGKSVSGTATLLYGPDCCSERDRLTFYLQALPSGYGYGGGVYGLLYLAPNDSEGPQDNTVEAGQGLGIRWLNTDPKSTFGYNPATGELPDGIAGFTNTLDVTGGFYDRTVNLQSYYSGRSLRVGSEFAAPGDFDGEQGESGYGLASLPDPAVLPATATAASSLTFQKSVLVKSGVLVDFAASVNPWFMTVSPNRSTGVFTGSCKFYYQGATQQKTKTIALKGVFLPVRAAYQDYADWMGFYLVPDAYRYLDADGHPGSYRFNWACDFSLVPSPTVDE